VRAVLVLLAIVMAGGCASHSPYTATPNPQASYRGGYAPLAPGECSWVEAHLALDGGEIPGGYHCNLGLTYREWATSGGTLSDRHAASLHSAGCSWVNGYSRKEGAYITGHFRCDLPPPETRVRTEQISSAPYSIKSPSGGSVRVRGYYRKDGTYVRSHTRRAPRRRY
jgi:hypothetical protein